MNFNELKQGIQTLSDSFRQNAALAINTHLTVRNWLIGFYIVEFEQNGEDRAKYGAKLLQNLADGFNEDGLSYRNLKLYRQFYELYPQVKAFVPKFIQKYFNGIGQTPIAQFQFPTNEQDIIGQTVSAQSKTPAGLQGALPMEKLLQKLSFSHLVLLFPIEDPLKRLFYEIECIKGTWSVRELKRQINSLYYERSGMSRNPALLSEIVQGSSKVSNMLNTIKSPFAFEFLGLKAKDVVYESDLEQALIEQLEEFLMELGHGMCFEARQKRIIIGGEYYFCDLVFYSRILKCHVLVEIKVSGFSHEHIGQLKTYVNYYRKEVMRPDDNPPVGILLVTDKNNAIVEYAMADSDRDIFVSKYMLELPTQEQLIRFVNEEFTKL
ncbi:MAG TPA: cytoplasmic protein [Porphyromonadaceae bacterium]|nr:cytoplasmic protein [Porphyromonadaceae bacterium]